MWLIPITTLFEGTFFQFAFGMKADYTWATKFLYGALVSLVGLRYNTEWAPLVIASVTIFSIELEQGLLNRSYPKEMYFGVGDLVMGCLGGLIISLLFNETLWLFLQLGIDISSL